jgi:hypothetical protein
MIDKELVQKTVYFYKSDIGIWEQVGKKTQFLHNALNPQEVSNAVANMKIDGLKTQYPRATKHVNFLDKKKKK